VNTGFSADEIESFDFARVTFWWNAVQELLDRTTHKEA
jgi:hypothetical protein